MDKEFDMSQEMIETSDLFDMKLDEEYGPERDEYYCEVISDALADGNEYGYVPYPGSDDSAEWELDINGHNSRDFECDAFYEYLLEDISHPVRDGFTSYLGLDIIINNNMRDSFDKDFFKKDLEMLGVYDEESFNT